jgi:hypothetical protein
MIAGLSHASRLRHYLSSMGVVAVLACILGNVVAQPAYAGEAARGDFPLWIEVPGDSFATLDHGQLPNGSKWGSYVSRVGAGSTNSKHPCVTVARLSAIGEFHSASDCGPLAGSSDAGREPVYASISETYQNRVGGPVRAETVMALTFGPKVVRVVMNLASGDEMAMHARLLSRRQQRKSGVVSLRFVALALQREVCVVGVTGYDSSQAELFTASTDLCPQRPNRRRSRPAYRDSRGHGERRRAHD